MSSFKGLDLFGSGPHRFAVGREGSRLVTYAAASGDPTVPGVFVSGDLDLRVTVTGRLVAASEPALWALRDAVAAEAASDADPGALADGRGRTWAGLKLVSFTPEGPAERGRAVSVPYTAEFVRTT